MASPFPELISVDQERCNLTRPSLRYDEACLLVSSSGPGTVTVLAQSLECHQCDLLEWATIEPSTSVPLLVQSKFPLNVTLKSSSQNLCTFVHDFGEKGIFSLNVTDSSCGHLITVREPDIALLPLLLVILFYAGLGIAWMALKHLRASDWYRNLAMRAGPTAELENDLGTPSTSDGKAIGTSEAAQAEKKKKSRLKSLDVFRGLCIAVMIFVNYGGGKYNFFEHATWNGLTIADLVFPSFMWIMGVSMVFSIRSQLRRGTTRRQLTLRVVKRGVKLIAIGFVLNTLGGHNSLAKFRFGGVLQRLGLCYIVVAVMEVHQLGLQSPQLPGARAPWLHDLRHSWPQWLATSLLVALHEAITFAMPVPGCPKGYTGPGGLHAHGQFANCTGGAAGYVDHLLLGENHLYAHPTCKKIYHTTRSFDPEGLLGTLTGVLLVQLGVQAGRIMLSYSETRPRLLRFLLWAALTGLVAGGLCGFATEGGVIPVNKNLYSLSFVLANASICFLVLGALYVLTDTLRLWEGAPFYYAGMNPMLLYVGHELASELLPWKWAPLTSSHAELLIMDAWAASLWIIIAFMLFRKNIFLII